MAILAVLALGALVSAVVLIGSGTKNDTLNEKPLEEKVFGVSSSDLVRVQLEKIISNHSVVLDRTAEHLAWFPAKSKNEKVNYFLFAKANASFPEEVPKGFQTVSCEKTKDCLCKTVKYNKTDAVLEVLDAESASVCDPPPDHHSLFVVHASHGSLRKFHHRRNASQPDENGVLYLSAAPAAS